MANEKKTIKTKKTTATKSEPTVEAPAVVEQSRWSLGGIFWGLLLIQIGVLALLANFDVITLDLTALLQLWPLLLIVWGVSVLRVRGMLWRLLMVGLMILTLVFVSLVAVGNTTINPQRAVETETLAIDKLAQESKRLNLTVDAGASKISIDSKDMSDAVQATLRSSVAKLERSFETRDGTDMVTLELESTRNWWFGGAKNELDIDLSRAIPTVLTLKSGAADINADLRAVLLDELMLDLGAASADVTIGDLRDNLKMTIDAGATSLTLHVPKSLGVRVVLDSGVSSNDFEGVDKQSDGVYESAGYDTAEKKVTITGDIGVTSFTIARY